MSRLLPFGFLFGKTLTDLIVGIRRNTDPEQRDKYLRSVVSECREEVRSANLDVKCQAVLKLAYLEMYGFDMSWAGFHVIEVMASPGFQQKRVGYMTASQCFKDDNDLKMLVTNLIKMDLVNQSSATVGIALSGLASIVSPGLAADVSDDIMRMLSHSQPYIRKKAVLALHNVVLQYPEALKPAIQRFSDLLDDSQHDLSDPGNISVASATVSVVCELATHAESVQDFLELTPRLYSLFSSSQHNWTLIKLLKVFQLFTKREPRLKQRLLPAIRNTMVTSNASSLVFECMRCILGGNMLDEEDYELGKEIVDQAISLMDTEDPNISFVVVGLLNDISLVNQRFLSEEFVQQLIKTKYQDPEIHKRVLNLAVSVVTDDSFYDLINELVSQFRGGNIEYKRDIAHSVCNLAAVNNYEFVPDFEWLASVLNEISEDIVDDVLAKRILDIVIRVKDDETRECMSDLCFKWLTKNPDADEGMFRDTCWWVISEFVSAKTSEDPIEFMELVASTQQASPIMVTAIAKIVAKNSTPGLVDTAIELLSGMSSTPDFEVQERSCQFLEILKLARSSPDQMEQLIANGLASLFTSYELGPIAPDSQLKVTVPEDLDFDTPIELPTDLPSMVNSDSSEVEDDDYGRFDQQSSMLLDTSTNKDTFVDISEVAVDAETQANREERQLFDLKKLSLQERSKPVKKKVVIAKDETVEGGALPPLKVKHKKNHSKNLRK